MNTMGYEAIRHELGHIAYGREEKPEEYAYREIEYCDVLVSVIGGKIWQQRQQESQYSITQEELRKAYDMGKQVYVTQPDRTVHHEFVFKLNKENSSTVYSVDEKNTRLSRRSLRDTASNISLQHGRRDNNDIKRTVGWYLSEIIGQKKQAERRRLSRKNYNGACRPLIS